MSSLGGSFTQADCELAFFPEQAQAMFVVLRERKLNSVVGRIADVGKPLLFAISLKYERLLADPEQARAA